jgi:hypothetical protein
LHTRFIATLAVFATLSFGLLNWYSQHTPIMQFAAVRHVPQSEWQLLLGWFMSHANTSQEQPLCHKVCMLQGQCQLQHHCLPLVADVYLCAAAHAWPHLAATSSGPTLTPTRAWPAGSLHVSKPTWWLESRFHFSFADYWNDKRMNFGALRVVNDDIVQGKAGFG